jgi:hypothetical protein
MEDLFPHKDGLDYSMLEITEEGSFSITRRRDAVRIINLLRFVFHNLSDYSITDSTACVGGDTINFSFNFKYVDSIELKTDNYKALSNNVLAYKLQNVKLYHGDCLDIFDWYTDILYIDPPWGGKDYRNKPLIDSYLSNVRLDIWLEDILMRSNRPRAIIMKLPNNYNFARFNFLPNIEVIKPYQIRSYVLVIITVHLPTLKTDEVLV